MVNFLGILGTAALFCFVAQQVYSDSGRQKRVLTEEEQVLANEARAHIAQTLEKNLIKFFTLVAADNGRELFGRQDDDDDDTTLNPQVLPQVAQILGAIFAGNLNLTNIIDRTFALAPEAIRNQVDGLFKLLTGQPQTSTTTSRPTTAKPSRRRRTSAKPSSSNSGDKEDSPPAPPEQTTARGQKYRVRNRANISTTVKPTETEFFPDEEELYKLEDEVISAAIDAEPYVRDKQPRFFMGPVREILANFDAGRLNITQVIRFLPDLFVGARHAFTLLENLGQIAGIDLDDD